MFRARTLMAGSRRAESKPAAGKMIELDQTHAAKPGARPEAMRHIDWVTILIWIWVAAVVGLALTILGAISLA
jgi:hypothetical protein